jgi:hypothetical protein
MLRGFFSFYVHSTELGFIVHLQRPAYFAANATSTPFLCIALVFPLPLEGPIICTLYKSPEKFSPWTLKMADPIETEYFEVIICGCGPTGALLSANLSRLGVKHVIIEKDPAITTDPRGIALDEDGIRLVQGVGKYKELFTDVGTGSALLLFRDSLF